VITSSGAVAAPWSRLVNTMADAAVSLVTTRLTLPLSPDTAPVTSSNT
jgi:hypothetical protein